ESSSLCASSIFEKSGSRVSISLVTRRTPYPRRAAHPPITTSLKGDLRFRSTARRNVLSSLFLKCCILSELLEGRHEGLHAHIHPELPHSSNRWSALIHELRFVRRCRCLEEVHEFSPTSVTELFRRLRQHRIVGQRTSQSEEEPHGMLFSQAQ